MIEMGNIHDISHQKAYIFLFMLEYFFLWLRVKMLSQILFVLLDLFRTFPVLALKKYSPFHTFIFININTKFNKNEK